MYPELSSLESLISVTPSGGIEWKIPGVDASFHDPSVMMLWYLLDFIPESTVTAQEKANNLLGTRTWSYPPELGSRVGILKELAVSPDAAIDILLTNEELLNNDILRSTTAQSVQEERMAAIITIRNAENYLLCGLMNPSGAYSLLQKLEQLGFGGKLWVLDKSRRPLDMTRVLWSNYWNKEFPGIQLELMQADLTCLETSGTATNISQRDIPRTNQIVTTIPQGFFNVIQMDTLGIYLPDETFINDLVMLRYLQAPGAVVIVSDMATFREVPPGSKKTNPIHDSHLNALIAAAKQLGWGLNPEKIRAIEAHAFTTQIPCDHLPRRSGLEHYYYPRITGICPRIVGTVTNETYWPTDLDVPARLFKYMLFRQEK